MSSDIQRILVLLPTPQVLYYANALAGELELSMKTVEDGNLRDLKPESELHADDADSGRDIYERFHSPHDSFAAELKVG